MAHARSQSVQGLPLGAYTMARCQCPLAGFEAAVTLQSFCISESDGQPAGILMRTGRGIESDGDPELFHSRSDSRHFSADCCHARINCRSKG
jgi:hypothetical protein